MTDLAIAGEEAAFGTTVVVGQLFRVRKGKEKRSIAEQPPEPVRRPAKVALQLALAHRIQRAIDAGEIKNQAEAARRLGFTRARVSQLLDLTFLAPDLQEQILSLERVDGIEPLAETALRVPELRDTWAQQRTRLKPTRLTKP